MIENILFPTDFSQNAKNALPFAIDLAKKKKAKLFLLHVYDIPLMPPANAFTTREMTMNAAGQRVYESSRKKMQELVVEFKLDDLPHEYAVRRGDTLYEIQESIKKNKIDFVIMGTMGETGKRELFMGSVTQALIQKVHCPILAIPGDCVFSNIERIAYATDLKSDETKVVAYLTKIAELYDSTLVILHVDDNPKNELQHTNKLKEIVENTEYPRISYKEIVVNEVSEGIETYIQTNQIDMLAMITNTTSIFDKIMHRSLTKKMLFHTHIPLLAFNRKQEAVILF